MFATSVCTLPNVIPLITMYVFAACFVVALLQWRRNTQWHVGVCLMYPHQRFDGGPFERRRADLADGSALVAASSIGFRLVRGVAQRTIVLFVVFSCLLAGALLNHYLELARLS